MAEIDVQVSSAIMDIKTFKDSEFVTGSSSRGIRNVVLG